MNAHEIQQTTQSRLAQVPKKGGICRRPVKSLVLYSSIIQEEMNSKSYLLAHILLHYM